MKKIVLVGSVVVLMAIVYWFVTINEPVTYDAYTAETFTFSTQEQQLIVRYDVTGAKVLVKFDGLQYGLEQAMSASGARFTNSDESIVFWEHQGEARLEINGQAVIEGARDQDTAMPNADILQNTAWQWTQTLYSNDDIIAPNQVDAFTLTFIDDGSFTATTDCNILFGSYEVEQNIVSFGSIAGTKMACPDIESQETVFANMLEETNGYVLTEEGMLALTLKYDTGSVMFSPLVP